MKKAVLFLLCGAFVLGLSLPTVKAVPGFKKEFEAMYVKPDGTASPRSRWPPLLKLCQVRNLPRRQREEGQECLRK